MIARGDSQAASLAREFMLDPGVAFLNHGSFGAVPRPVFEERVRLQREIELNPVRSLARALEPALDQARARLGVALGAPAEELAWAENATTGLNLLARSLVPRVSEGGEVLVTNLEYGAQLLAWEWLCARHRIGYRQAALTVPGAGGDALEAQLLGHVGDRTRIVLMSHVTSDTALRLPVERVCAELARRGILSVIDGAHAPGQIPLHLNGAAWDYYVGNIHKWFAAPRGAAFIYASRDNKRALDPLVISWGGTDPDTTLAARTGWHGTHDPSAWLTVPFALDFHNRRLRPLVPHARSVLAELRAELIRAGLAPASQRPDPDLLMASFLLPDSGAADRLEQRLAAERIEALVKRDGPNGPILRVCVAWYVTHRDTRRLIDAVAAALGGS
ncbi:MAG TPA: aminotransferase class V-fold PLP-dependent enzyme [Solirubrobacteraceae bacterium]